MPIYSRCSRCGSRIPAGSVCRCRKVAEAARQRLYDTYQRDKRGRTFYNGREWETVRNEALFLDEGIDVYVYMTTGEIMIADVVHHIEPLADNWNRRKDITNLMSLNHSTHGRIERMYKTDKQKMIRELTEMLKEYREGKV